MNAEKDEDTYDAEETERRREAALKRMLATPPKLHRDSKVSRKPKAKGPKAKPSERQ